MGDMQVHFLGSGDAFSASGKHQAGYLVRGGGTAFLLDCGSMVLASMKRDGVDPDCVDTIFLSHLHGDHFAGLPYLFIQYTYEEPRRRPLRIVGPPATAERVMALYAAAYRELSTKPLPFELQFTHLLPRRPVAIGDVLVEPFLVPHQEREVSYGLRLEIDGRVILYSGDTGWTEELVTRSQGVDLFICECCYFETRFPFHLDYPRLAENRHRFGAKRMILTHLGREVLARRDEIELELASDGLVVEI